MRFVHKKTALGKKPTAVFITCFEHDLQDYPMNRINQKISVIVFRVFKLPLAKTNGGFLLPVVL
jgi:hypothetical protein